MQMHEVRVFGPQEPPNKARELAHCIARVAADRAPIDAHAREMVINRFIDNAAVAIGGINLPPVANARSQALCHPRPGGATLFGMPSENTVDAEWAAYANCAAVRELDMHDTFLAADYAHPGDTIPAVLAVAQQCGNSHGLSGDDLIRGVLVAYEIQIALVKGICLHEYRIDHVAHLGPAQAAGIGALLGLDAETIYHAVQQAAHVSFATRQGRRGAMSSWKTFAPAHVAKLAIECVDRAMRGEKGPSPIYEGEDGILARLLGGATYQVPLPEPGEPCCGILESYTKEHAAEYQCQALIDLAFSVRQKIPHLRDIEEIVIHTSRTTHLRIGSGAEDPEKLNPRASRETLEQSLMYVFAVALQDGIWHHITSYSPERVSRPDTVELWHKIRTVEDDEWTRRFHSSDPGEKAFGGRVEIRLKNDERIWDEKAVANAHSLGEHPYEREDYVRKFNHLTNGLVTDAEQDRFLGHVCTIPDFEAADLGRLNLQVPPERLRSHARDNRGIF